MNKVIYILYLMYITLAAFAQDVPILDSTAILIEAQEQKLIIHGYVKNMQILDFAKTLNAVNATNLIHNRINSRWIPNENFTVVAEFRNRVIWGDEVKYVPNYAAFLRNPNESLDLSVKWFSNSSLIGHTNTDRLFAEYRKNKISARIGRQRINWGMATLWNPNDLFNTYNFLDFDYEERPGRDALRLTAELGNFSGIDLAYAHGLNTNQKVWATKVFFNTNGFDLQLTNGLMGKRYTGGFGWAGSIGNAGFKGELQYFGKYLNESSQINVVLESDYVFQNGWYINGSFLYNKYGINKKVVSPLEFNFKFSPINLMPTRWNFFLTTSKEISPLFSINTSVLFAPGTNLLLILPGINWSTAENLSLDLTWQSFFASIPEFEAMNHRGFIRMKYNF